ncbi:Cytochrome c oxidase subunit 4 [Rhizoclosmatium sp. JEL0117]|nr:Cytochrome c oxidase subunit 4 [Rhizoclosmatium hyalinum]KAJ3287602.1 Cytochrome c oxidase subunit 4 [Rhizoclosmatium sp. JEL0117]
MFAVRRAASLASIRAAAAAKRFSTAAVVRGSHGVQGHDDPYNTPIPGYRAPGQIAHNWEIAAGNERYEYVKRLEGEEPWEDMQPYLLTSKPTAQNPFIVKGTDPEKYLGCTGFPADTHETVWLTLRPHRGVDRCPHCGNAYKYEQADAHHH